MRVTVSRHAIKRCRDRVPRMADASEVEIKKTLAEVIRKGKRLKKRPTIKGSAHEYVFRGIYAVGVTCGNSTVVVTCYGDDVYRRWLYGQKKCCLRRAC